MALNSAGQAERSDNNMDTRNAYKKYRKARMPRQFANLRTGGD
jgi:hypothetical protein